MNSYNNRLHTGGYETWKGRGIHGNPVGVTSGSMRPLTNKDPANDAIYKFGLPRPIKQYRKGIAIPVFINPSDPNALYRDLNETYYSNRHVKSSVRNKMVSQLMDTPGQYIVKENSLINPDDDKLVTDCNTCKGIGLVSGWYPINNLTEKPQPNVMNPLLCCNQQRKAVRRVLPASTILKKNYFTTTDQYLRNRCQTYRQRVFNFARGVNDPNIYNLTDEYPIITEQAIANAKPGSPLSYSNLYVANCTPNGEIATAADILIIQRISYILLSNNIISEDQYNELYNLNYDEVPLLINYLQNLPSIQSERSLAIAAEILYNPYDISLITGPSNRKGCKLVEYKPNNPQFAVQGAVSSSTRILKLNVTTIERNAAKNKQVQQSAAANVLLTNNPPFIPFIYKSKVPTCNPGLYIKNGNPKTCFKNTNDIANSKYAPAYSFNSVVNQLSDMSSIVNH
jgi:hypothetical protein